MALNPIFSSREFLSLPGPAFASWNSGSEAGALPGGDGAQISGLIWGDRDGAADNPAPDLLQLC